MRNYNLGFIDDETIYNHVKETAMLYRSKILDLKEFNKNIIDPIKLTFDAKVYGKSLKEVIVSECVRQIDKTNSNHIGYFHQNLFKYAGNGWEVPEKGFDVINKERHIFVEMKNKHNTMNDASSQKTYIKMQSKILEDDAAVCMLVEVIAKKSGNNKWNAKVNGQNFSHDRIRRVSMDKFYEVVFGDALAFFKLCKALPDILDDVIAEIGETSAANKVYKELSAISPDVLKSIYLLAFEKYDGFDQL